MSWPEAILVWGLITVVLILIGWMVYMLVKDTLKERNKSRRAKK